MDNNLYPKSKQTEGAISQLNMFLYQAYMEEQGLFHEEAKAKVIATIEEGIRRFKGNSKEEVKQEKKVVNAVKPINSTLAIKEINESLKGLKQSSIYRNRSKYFIDTIDFNFNQLLKNNELK